MVQRLLQGRTVEQGKGLVAYEELHCQRNNVEQGKGRTVVIRTVEQGKGRLLHCILAFACTINCSDILLQGGPKRTTPLLNRI